MTDILIEATEFNCENIKYSSPKANSVGGKAINIYNKVYRTLDLIIPNHFVQ